MIKKWSFYFDLDTENQSVPLYQQIANKIKEMIHSGILKKGNVLPSSRELAEELGISRKTVVNAMEQLVYKGILVNKERVGFFVAERKGHTQENAQPTPEKTDISETNMLVVDDGFPDSQLLPFKEFTRAYRQLFNRAAQWKMLGYMCPMGHVRFRQRVSTILSHGRGLQFSANEICITRGSQMALYLVAHSLLQPGETIVVENPGYERAKEAFRHGGLNVIPVDTDKDGIDTDQLETVCNTHNIKAVYLTPRHHYPTTVSLSPSRRKKIVKLVEQHDFYVIEDDFGADFHYVGKQLAPLSCMIPKKNRIYVGTFSKIFAPALRVGYIAAREEVIQRVAQLRNLIDIQGDNIIEKTLFDLLEEGVLLRHVRKTSKIYKEKLMYISERIKFLLGKKAEYRKPTGGLAIWLCLNTGKSGDEIERQLRQKSVSIEVLNTGKDTVGMRIGFASLSFQEIDTLIGAISQLEL